ncbi:MAG TPA: DUF4834 family protein [Pedobacter sp.]|jgi:hypothetical protein
MGFIIRFIFIAILILWIIRVLLRLVFPMVLKSIFGSMQQQQSGQSNYQQTRKPEGAITIDYVPPQPKHGNADKLGDFVEYEEVK